jgi:hypothetical protein
MASAPRLTEGTHVLNSDNFAIYPGSHLIRFSRSLLGRGASITASNLQRQYALQRGRLDGCLDSRQLTPLAAALQLQGLGSVWELGYDQSRGWRQKKFVGPLLPGFAPFTIYGNTAIGDCSRKCPWQGGRHYRTHLNNRRRRTGTKHYRRLL